MEQSERKIRIFLICFVITYILINTFGISSCGLYGSNNDAFKYSHAQDGLTTSQHQGYVNITEFWEDEKVRVETTIPNIWRGETVQKTSSGVTYNQTEISYDVPNWVDAEVPTFRINATVFTPSNKSGSLNVLPGVAAYHGLGSVRTELYQFAIEALTVSDLDIVILCPDQPGHGDSGGPPYTPSNWKYGGDFNKTSHNYLAICGGLQAIRVIQSLPGVDSTKIAVTGNSYGGMTSMWVSSIYADRVSLSMPTIACGGLEYIHDESLIYNVMGSKPGDLDEWWKNQGKETDPIYYIGTKDYPKSCWFFGTHDDFFPYESLNLTYNEVIASDQKWLHIAPNAHHGLSDDLHTKYFLLRQAFYDGEDPPEISLVDRTDAEGIMFDSYDVRVQVDSAAAIDRVEVCYRYKDIFAEPWRWEEMPKVEGNGNEWETRIKTPWLTSETEFYFIVHLDTEQSVWFTSQIFTAGVLKNNLSFLPLSVMVVGLLFLIYIILQQRYRDDVLPYTGELKRKLTIYFGIETAGVIIGEAVLFGSLALPWLDLGTISWNHLYLIEHVGSYTGILSGLAYFSGFFLFSTWVSGMFMALANPLKGGVANLGWPILMVFITTIGTDMIGMGQMLAIGPFIFMIGGVIQIAFGLWQKIYRKRLGIPEKPYFHWLKRNERIIEEARGKINQPS